jgi:Ca2+/H+ antiporter, TMEM165/GDT1 family
MRFTKSSIPLSLALLWVIALASPIESENSLDATDGTSLLDSTSVISSATSTSTSKSTVGRKDAPVDGKDGRPHAGPWVETEADRIRKKAKENGQDETNTPANKPKPKEPSKTTATVEYPETNDGVMDDPHRVGPKEGTRGTEGGISEKTREKQENLDTSLQENKPDEPKEAPPLPHSEQEQLAAGKEPKPKPTDEDEKPKAQVEDLELGGLTVCDRISF